MYTRYDGAEIGATHYIRGMVARKSAPRTFISIRWRGPSAPRATAYDWVAPLEKFTNVRTLVGKLLILYPLAESTHFTLEIA